MEADERSTETDRVDADGKLTASALTEVDEGLT